MKIAESATISAPADSVWAALTDPAVLAAAIPGCDAIKPTSPGHWRFALTMSVASFHGTITGDATLTDRQEPSTLTVCARGAGEPGTVAVTVRIALAPGPDNSTELSIDADAAIGGQVAGVGQRVLASAGARMGGQFLGTLDQILSGNGVVSPGPPQPARSSGLPPATDSETRSILPGVLAGGAAGAVAGFVAARLIARRGR